ncbi:ABC transporter ATP-binding protein [Enterovirga sp. CN4-39]|uniref:ABC transporter ATP-binding protein n=1 Tax=Enterovirga sp. CN4-39 TaxID=3400910 RepID=UPI003BFE795F
MLKRASSPARDAAGSSPAASVRISSLVKSFGSVRAVSGVDLALPPGSLTSLLGPSGCGKTTLLRMIAGLEEPSAGEIEVNGRPMRDVPIHKRNIGIVFQNYALFPHKTVRDNVGFGLKYRGITGQEAETRVRRALEMVRLDGFETRLPSQLSGGQQQRVALARAVVFEPDLLLLDEPLSALDANLREQMRLEIKLIQRQLGLTTILVTHDQQEALAMSDEIVVMHEGRVQQKGPPAEVFRHPANQFVAGFMGQANILPATLAEASEAGTCRVSLVGGHVVDGRLGAGSAGALAPGDIVDLVIRSSEIGLSRRGVGCDGAIEGRVEDASFLGDDALYLVDLGSLKLKVSRRVSDEADAELLDPGTPVCIELRPSACTVLPRMETRS